MMSEKSVLAGELSFVSLSDCFQILGGNNSTGTLQLTNPNIPAPGVIYFVDGNPVDATSGSLAGVEAIYSLFGWVDGSFRFIEGPVSRPVVITNSRMEIVLDAMRMLDDGVTKRVGGTFSQENVDSFRDSDNPTTTRELPVIKGPFVDYMYVVDEEGFRDGTKIVTEGGHGNWIWVILEGMVQVTREVPGGTLDLARLGEGCFIGTVISFVERHYMRNVSVTAVGDLQVGVLDTQRLYQEYIALSKELQTLIVSLDGRLQKITDRAAALYENKNNGLKLPEKKKLVLKQGSPKEGGYAINQGNAYLVTQKGNGYRPLICLEAGDIFGNIPFIDAGLEPRNAAVVASEDLKVSRVDTQVLQQEYKQLPAIFRNLMEGVCTCVSMTTHLINSL